MASQRRDQDVISTYQFQEHTDTEREGGHAPAGDHGNKWTGRAQMVAAMQERVQQGDVRRFSVTNERGKTLLEVPHLLGVGRATMEPVWAALDALARVAGSLTIQIESEEGGW